MVIILCITMPINRLNNIVNLKRIKEPNSHRLGANKHFDSSTFVEGSRHYNPRCLYCTHTIQPRINCTNIPKGMSNKLTKEYRMGLKKQAQFVPDWSSFLSAPLVWTKKKSCTSIVMQLFL